MPQIGMIYSLEDWKIVLFLIHVLFINWRNLSFFQNIKKFSHLCRLNKNICQLFEVDLSIKLKSFGWNITINSRYVYR